MKLGWSYIDIDYHSIIHQEYGNNHTPDDGGDDKKSVSAVVLTLL